MIKGHLLWSTTIIQCFQPKTVNFTKSLRVTDQFPLEFRNMHSAGKLELETMLALDGETELVKKHRALHDMLAQAQ